MDADKYCLLKPMRIIVDHIIAFFLFAILLTGCASGRLRDAGNKFYAGQPVQAVAKLNNKSDFYEKDFLLLYMEKGSILFYLERYEESIQILLKASRIMDQQETISFKEQSASLITNDWITEYDGEYNERLWVHTYLIMNFIMTYNYDAALVEGKQALKLINKYEKPLYGAFFTKTMIAMCFELAGEKNDALIAYKRLAESIPDPDSLDPILYQLCLDLGFNEDAGIYQKRLSNSEDALGFDPDSEIIVFIGQGRSPQKVPNSIVLPPSIRFAFPKYQPAGITAKSIRSFESGRELKTISIFSDMNIIAKASLDNRAATLIAKETTRVIAKEIAAQAVGKGTNSQLLEIITRITLFLLEEPDTRHWQLLPASQSILRIPLRSGSHKIEIAVYDKNKRIIKLVSLPEFATGKGQKTFFSIRMDEKITLISQSDFFVSSK